MGSYAEYASVLPEPKRGWWIEGAKKFAAAKVVNGRKGFSSWDHENKAFYGRLSERHLESAGFLASVRNSVGKQSYWRSRPKGISKSLAGEVLGRQSISHETRKNLAYADANRALLEVDQQLTIRDLKLSWDDQSLVYWAKAKAEWCERMLQVDPYALHVIKWAVNSYGFRWPTSSSSLDLFGETSAVLRVFDQRWWRRQARVAKFRVMDQVARAFHMVHVRSQVYCSNQAVHLRRGQARRNRMMLEGMQAVNDDGDEYTLAELSDLSVSNPVNRRNELMVRMKGFETLAKQFGDLGLFVTLTSPSRFHPMRQIKNHKGNLVRVDENELYDGSTPRQAQKWLSKTWELIRSKFDRSGIRCYGFRVVEPNHDGTPHWHQLLFFRPDQIPLVKQIFKAYALRTDADERGAKTHRLKIVDIDYRKGSATGYIAKYISKSIDGTHIDEDLFGNSGADAAERICAWASGWGVRQFQQIGGASVTVWRELRRMALAEGVVERARQYADANDWAAYCLVQGAGEQFFGRDDQAIRPAYWQEYRVDQSTGEVEFLDPLETNYLEVSPGRLFGVKVADAVGGVKYFMSRFYRWTIDRMGMAVKAVEKALPVSTLSADELLDLLRGDGLGSTA